MGFSVLSVEFCEAGCCMFLPEGDGRITLVSWVVLSMLL